MPGNLHRVFFGHVSVPRVPAFIVQGVTEGQNFDLHECSDRDRYGGECAVDLVIAALDPIAYGNNMGNGSPFLLHSRNRRYF